MSGKPASIPGSRVERSGEEETEIAKAVALVDTNTSAADAMFGVRIGRTHANKVLRLIKRFNQIPGNKFKVADLAFSAPEIAVEMDNLLAKKASNDNLFPFDIQIVEADNPTVRHAPKSGTNPVLPGATHPCHIHIGAQRRAGPR